MSKKLLKRAMVTGKCKKGLAVLMSVALITTAFSAAPSSAAAAKTTPSLSTKAKTLYYNGTKKFTLKVKKNKAKKIVKTTWKTSNKKVAVLSKGKKTSVVVTAKKKGTAKITATVTYKAGSKTKKVKLTCTVTSKKKTGSTGSNKTPAPTAGGNATPTPASGGDTTPTPASGGDATPAPTAGGDTTPAPTAGGDTTPAPTAGGNTTPAPTPGGDTTPAPTPGGNATSAPADRTLETVVGNDDSANAPKSMEYSMKEKNSKVTFYVKALSDSHVFIELNQGDNFITLNTYADAWTYPEARQTQLTANKVDSSFSNFLAGKEYTITVTRKDYVETNTSKTDYEIVVKDPTTDSVYMTLSAKNAVLTGDVSSYLKVVSGKIEMRSDSVPKPQPQRHGTDRTKRYSLSDVNNTPPTDYVIPDGVVKEAKDKSYEKYFPKNSIQTVNVEMDEGNLNYMLQRAGEKPSVMTNSVTIGDTKLGYVGIKTKGNYTLSATNESDSDRFSFTLNFGKYIKKKQYGKKQNFYGCQKISFNNCFFDKTIMKEYNAMRLMDEMGIPTPQYSLAKLYINGRYYGVYFMVEAMDPAIIERYQNVSSADVSDYLVKPDYTKMNYNFEAELESCLNAEKEFTMDTLAQGGQLWKGDDGNYHVGETLEKYGSIWEHDDDTLQDVAKMIPTVLTWNRKVQLLSDGKDFNGQDINVNSKDYLELLETVMDTDEAVRYFATHSFLVQLDNMFTWGQNYGLYVDKNGKSLFVPWDYDLAWGTAIWDGATITAEQSANWNIDKMYPDNFDNYGNISEEEVYSRAPLFDVIWQNETLRDKYHTYMEDCAKLVSLGGTTSDGVTTVEPARFAKTIDEYYPLVKAAAGEELAENVSYVGGIQQPAGAQEGIPELKKLIARRAVSVWLQLQGKDANVTGYGCDIMKIGTNFNGRESSTVKGDITMVDEDTGIFAAVTYPNTNNAAGIRAQQLTSGVEYNAISAKVEGDPLVYKVEFTNAATLTSEYKLYVPVSSGDEGKKIYKYQTDGDNLEELTADEDTEDNIYCVTGTGFTYIVIASSEN